MMSRVVRQHQVRQADNRLMQHTEVVIGPDVAIDHDKGVITQQRQCTENPAAGFQRLALRRVLDADAIARTVAQIILDLLTEPGMVDHDLGKPGGRQRSQVILDQRHSAGANQRLWRGQGQRAHALAFAGRQNHRLHAFTPARRLASSTSSSASSGRRAITASI
ncbi:hypothetical protein D3C85_1017510 [compost metagenome]